MLSGEGARQYGGRWNSPGLAAVYLGDSLALAAMELLVHLRNVDVLRTYRTLPVHVPEEVLMHIDPGELPTGWESGARATTGTGGSRTAAPSDRGPTGPLSVAIRASRTRRSVAFAGTQRGDRWREQLHSQPGPWRHASHPDRTDLFRYQAAMSDLRFDPRLGSAPAVAIRGVGKLATHLARAVAPSEQTLMIHSIQRRRRTLAGRGRGQGAFADRGDRGGFQRARRLRTRCRFLPAVA